MALQSSQSSNTEKRVKGSSVKPAKFTLVKADPGKVNIEIPEEFEVASLKVKELKQLLPKVVAVSKKYSKSYQAYSKATLELVPIFNSSELQSIVFFGNTIEKIADVQKTCEASHREISNKILTTLREPSEKFLNEVVQPTLEAKKVWKKARNDFEGAKTKLESCLKHEHSEPLKLITAQSHFHLERLKEQEKFDKAADALGDTLWERDFEFFWAVTTFMIELHDCSLNAYSDFYEMDNNYLKTVRSAIAMKREKFNERVRKREEDRKKEEEALEEDKYSDLFDILSTNEFALLNAMCVTAGVEQDNILCSIIKIFDAYNRTLPIIKSCITTEVAATKNPSTLFRGNSTATKLMMTFTKMIGKEYLMEIKSLIQVVLDDVDGYEVDPGKVPDPELRAKNINKLISTCQQFLDAIITSIDRCPVVFREVANHLQQEATKAFPNSHNTAVGGFIFLRFFCPGILSPETAGIISSPLSSEQRRPLVLISKCIQNLANGQKFANKESYINEGNSFIESNMAGVQNYLTKFAEIPDEYDYKPLCSIEEARETELKVLHEYLVKHLEKISKTLASYKNENLIEPLCKILGELGDCAVEPDQQKDKAKKSKAGGVDKKKDK